MSGKAKTKRFLLSVYRFFVLFLMIAFIVTCCMTLFLNTMMRAMKIEFTDEMINNAAKLTFVNVILLSLIYAAIDAVRRKITLSRPTKRITDAAERLMQGDFSVRIRPIHSVDPGNKFNEIIDCFNRMAEELESTQTLQTDFIANVSHELKTPLAVMRNYATMLEKDGLNEAERKEYAHAVSSACRRLADLVTNILKLNKLENQQIVLSPTKYDLGEQLCECLLGFEAVWEKKNIEIETDIEDGVFVKSDAEMMSLVWNNLFSNAIKFTEAGGTIELSLKTEGKYAVVNVRDTGCGISKEVGAHIFEKFYQGDTSRASQGNGLGLALVKRIIDITGSDISVKSELGKGSVFTVKIRRADDENI